MTKQLDLPLWDTLRSAQMMPEQVDFEGLLEEVEKAAVLAMVGQMEAEALRKEAVLAIAHDENVSTWIEAINC